MPRDHGWGWRCPRPGRSPQRDPPGDLVDREAERVAEAHGVDLRPRLGGSRREQVAGRNRVGAVGLGVDAQDLAAQVVGVGRGPLGVVVLPARPLVDRGVAAGGVGVGVVTRADVQVAARPEREVAPGVARLVDVAVRRNLDDLLFAAQVEAGAVEGEPGHPVHLAAVGRRVVEVDPAVGGEVRIERQPDPAVLTAVVHRQRADDARAPAVRGDHVHLAGARDVEDPAVGGHVQLHRLVGRAVEGHLLEPGRDRAAAVTRRRAGSHFTAPSRCCLNSGSE